MGGRSIRNESTFRDANEQLRSSREQLAALGAGAVVARDADPRRNGA